MREIDRKIVSGIVFSKDGKVLMGLKDPAAGGVYTDAWHIPGGGLQDDESLEVALARELKEEVGIDVADASRVVKVETLGHGTAEKTLSDGERVLCHMEFNRFEVHLGKNAEDIKLTSESDLVELRWFTPEELLDVKQIPGGREFFEEMNYMPKVPDEFKNSLR